MQLVIVGRQEPEIPIQEGRKGGLTFDKKRKAD